MTSRSSSELTPTSFTPSQEAITRRRAFGVVAHVDAGKTTLTERILHATGRIHRVGSVDSGNTVTDSDPREKSHGITIGAAAVSVTHRGHALTLIDTPGHVDFGIEVVRSLRVLDAAIVVLDAVSGVEPQTESVWQKADEREIPRLAFINKVDRAGADFSACVRSIEATFDVRALPLVEPSTDGTYLLDLVRGVRIDATDGPTTPGAPLDGAELERARRARAAIIDAASSFDDALIATVLSGRDPSHEEILAALRRGVIARRILPVLAGSAKMGLGVHALLDAIVDLLPHPADRSDGGVVDANEPLVAFAFKRTRDAHGSRTFVRVYTGTLARGDTVRLGRARAKTRIGRLARLFADRVEDVQSVGPGEIVAILGSPVEAGETLTALGDDRVLEDIHVHAPVLSIALEPKTTDDRSRLGPALSLLTEEDPSLALGADPETGQTLLSGQGELHLQITLEKLAEDHRVSVTASSPKVAYRETITAKAEALVRYIKQKGGPGQFAVVEIVIEPAPRGAGISFRDATVGGTVPRAFIPAIERGVREAALSGPRFGDPVEDFTATLVGGDFHPNDSNEMAFHVAAKLATAEAFAKARPVRLEPIMIVDVTCPEPSLGTVLGDLAGRRGRVEAISEKSGARVIAARTPLAELVGYVTRLRSLTQGRGSASMRLAGYEPTS